MEEQTSGFNGFKKILIKDVNKSLFWLYDSYKSAVNVFIQLFRIEYNEIHFCPTYFILPSQFTVIFSNLYFVMSTWELTGQTLSSILLVSVHLFELNDDLN